MKIFGTDGVRGRANTPPMTVETALSLGRAAGKLFQKSGKRARIVIGKDTRLSSYMFENALISGLCSMGVDTLMLGPFPTPGVAFLTRAYRADAGVVISASHNPFYDNGIKFFSSEGFKFPDSWEQQIEELVAQNNYYDCLPADDALGKNTKVKDAHGRYIEFAKATYPKNLTLNGMRIALDCANGAAWHVGPPIFEELGAKVVQTGTAPNGLNINLGCGSLHPESVSKVVLENHCHIGISLDGDGDRLILVDELGHIVDGDTILALCSLDLKRQGRLKNHRVVGTVMTNWGLVNLMREEGIELLLAPVGDRHVIQKMIEYDAILGGEQSGHMIFLDHNTTGDGLVSALQVLHIMVETGKSLSELAACFTKCPQICLDIPVSSKPPLESLTAVQSRVKQIEDQLKGSGRVLIRYSGTEQICRVMVEGPVKDEVQAFADELASLVGKEIGG